MAAKKKIKAATPLEVGTKQLLRIRAEQDGYRRGGIAHTKAAVDHPADAFTAEQLQVLQDDPRITLTVIDAPTES